ncbi:MAG: inorganic phosphate transporter [Methyloceanibacter sp.]|nr:inorganic phosphate transporter [Methyloceanibacter sp.]
MAKRGNGAKKKRADRVIRPRVGAASLRRRAHEPGTPLDKDLRKIERLEEATRAASRSYLALGATLVFLLAAALLADSHAVRGQSELLLVFAAVIGGYLALTIGANDVANNVGPAVGARALSMTGALALAAVFECAGALIAGDEVVETISQDLIDPALLPNTDVFVWVMMSAMLAAALWVHLATYVGAPISTTHSIVGGVLGAGLIGLGASALDWSVVASVFAAWLLSPIAGAFIAAALVAFIEINMIYKPDKIAAVRRWLPVLVALMAAVFFAFISLNVFGQGWGLDARLVLLTCVSVFGLVYLLAGPWVHAQSEGMENRNQNVRQLFRSPLIFAACLLSFAHGSNDVANAVAPLAAVLENAGQPELLEPEGVPFWVMLIGATGISLGLFLYGPRIVRVVGVQITRMNPMRAFCVALAAAFTVLVASELGMPVSTTQTVVGAVFGIGFFREFAARYSRQRRYYILTKKSRQAAPVFPATRDEILRRKLVRRSHFIGIVATWAVTVPCAATIAALIYAGIDWIR